MNLIKDILDNTDHEKFNSLDLKDLNFKEYKQELDSRLKKISENNYQIFDCEIIKAFILAVIEQNSEKQKELESIHYDLLMNWLSTYQKDTLSSIMSGKEIVTFFVSIISSEKLNHYSEESQNSILKQLLLRYENNSLFQIFYDNGLKFESVEGLNPYYYSLLNGTSTNMLTQLLFKNKIPLPKGYWSYIFESISKGAIKEERDFLLYSDEKDFIVNEKTKESVWHIILKTKKYDLIKYLSDDFYKPYILNGKTILDYMVEKNDFSLIKELGFKIIKLLESTEDISNVLSHIIKNSENRKFFIEKFLYQIINIPKNESQINNKFFIDLKSEWNNANDYINLNQQEILAQLILISYKKENLVIVEEEKLKESLLDIKNVIQIYRTKKEISENIRKQILAYLNLFGEYNADLNNQSSEYYNSHEKFINNLQLLKEYRNNNKDINDNIFCNLFLNMEIKIFESVCEDAINYLKSFKIPDMHQIYEEFSDFYNQRLDFFSNEDSEKNDFKLIEEQNELNFDVFMNEDSMREHILKIEKLIGSNEKEANQAADNIIKDIKIISKYPSLIPKSIYDNTFIKTLNNIVNDVDTEENINFLEKINTSLKTPKKDKIEIVISIDKEVTKEDEIKEDEIKEDDLRLDLFTDESFTKFKKEFGDSNNEVLTSFIKKHASPGLYKNKTLAKASLLLEKIDSLYETFPHFEKVIKHIEDFMVLQNKGDKSFYIPPLLLGGGPGVGKTFFCNTISKLVNTNFELLNMESMTANFILTGSNSQWRDATPGKIFRALFDKEKPNMNPIFLLDELEKAGGDSRYSVMNSLLPLLERYTAKNFKDECIPLAIDASYIVWFATANDIDKLTPPIKSRFDILSVPNPNPTQRKSLIKGIYKTVRDNNSWGQYFDENLPEDSLDVLSNLMAPGAARDLRKSLTMACSKAIREDSKLILPKHIERYENGETMPWDIVLST